jgi:hypothetical protein
MDGFGSVFIIAGLIMLMAVWGRVQKKNRR